MEVTKVEVEAIEHMVGQLEQGNLSPIEDLHLALIGGGIADPVWA